MTITEDMIATARQCRGVLDDEAVQVITDYIYSQWDDAGGFYGRDDRPDLYYTLFAAECLEILQQPLPRGFSSYLARFGQGETLDLIHLSCLGRCLALNDAEAQDSHLTEAIMHRLLVLARAEGLSVYGAFVTRLALEDMGLSEQNSNGWDAAFTALKTEDGGYAEQNLGNQGTTPVTAAAAVLQSTGSEIDDTLVPWLKSRHGWMGGFHATPQAPVPDLLSTATALFALKRLGIDLTPFREDGLAFVESLWTESGGFSGHLIDPLPDCEYTFYGLLALGTLAPITHGNDNEPQT